MTETDPSGNITSHVKKKNNCFLKGCRKKIKLTDYPCKCKHIYCSKHRLPETHDCNWNPKNSKEFNVYKKKAGLDHTVKFKKLMRI